VTILIADQTAILSLRLMFADFAKAQGRYAGDILLITNAFRSPTHLHPDFRF